MTRSSKQPGTVASFLEEWLQSISYSVRPRTARRYAEYVRLHALPTLGDRPLSSLSPKDLQLLYAERVEQGLSSMSVRHLHQTLHRAFGQAQRWGIVEVNPASLVDPPRVERSEMQTLSPEEASRFLEAGRGDRLEALYTLAITTGMRQGELLGLHWREVDLERCSVKVIGSMQYAPGEGLGVVPPKTPRSRRNVLLSGLAVDALRRHQIFQEGERLAGDPGWNEGDLVFVNSCGRPIYAANLMRRSFLGLLGQAGLRRIRFHDLRHTAATLLLGQNVHPKVVSEMLGHTTTSITLDLYSHATPTMQREAAAAIDSLLGSGPQPN